MFIDEKSLFLDWIVNIIKEKKNTVIVREEEIEIDSSGTMLSIVME